MSSNIDQYDNTVTVDFIAVAVIEKKRLKKSKGVAYTNLRCDHCMEWWIMLCLGKKRKVCCPWCGADCKVKRME